MLFQWRRGGGDRFRVTFESDRVRVTLYTDGEHADCAAARTGLGCFEPNLEIWRYIAGSNPRGSARVTVDGALAASPGVYHRSATLSIGFSRGPVPGAIYYWSTTVEGARRATVGDAAPTNFLTPPEADRNCVACHTLSRRGNLMAADVGGNKLWVVEASPTTPPRRVLAPAGPAWQWERRLVGRMSREGASGRARSMRVEGASPPSEDAAPAPWGVLGELNPLECLSSGLGAADDAALRRPEAAE